MRHYTEKDKEILTYLNDVCTNSSITVKDFLDSYLKKNCPNIGVSLTANTLDFYARDQNSYQSLIDIFFILKDFQETNLINLYTTKRIKSNSITIGSVGKNYHKFNSIQYTKETPLDMQIVYDLIQSIIYIKPTCRELIANNFIPPHLLSLRQAERGLKHSHISIIIAGIALLANVIFGIIDCTTQKKAKFNHINSEGKIYILMNSNDTIHTIDSVYIHDTICTHDTTYVHDTIFLDKAIEISPQTLKH